MDIALTPELERRVMEKVEAGLYASASEVVREGLRLLFVADGVESGLRDQLDAAIQRGLDQLDRGGIDGEASRRRLLARFATTGG